MTDSILGESDWLNDQSLGLENSIWECLSDKGKLASKVGCVFPMVAVSMFPHAKFGPNDYREDTSLFIPIRAGTFFEP